MNTQLVLTRAIVLLVVVSAFIVWLAIGISEFIALGNDMTADEDFADMCARTETS